LANFVLAHLLSFHILDFLPDKIFRSLDRDNTKLSDGSFAIMITPQPDALGHDTVVGPEFSLSGEGEAIEDLIIGGQSFDNILRDMKSGKTGSGTFTRVSNGDEEEVYVSYAPVFVRSFTAVDSSDLRRGVTNETILVYSLALVETTNGLIQSFESIDSFASKTVNICIGVLSAIIVTSTVLIVYTAFRVTSSMTKPILQLLSVMKSINR